MTNNEEMVRFLLRAGIAFSFIYTAVAIFLNPLSWTGYFPNFLLKIFSGNEILLLYIFSISEILIAIWILIGRNARLPSILASIYLTLIIISNFQFMDIIFRDISILAMALSLTILEKTNLFKTTT